MGYFYRGFICPWESIFTLSISLDTSQYSHALYTTSLVPVASYEQTIYTVLYFIK